MGGIYRPPGFEYYDSFIRNFDLIFNDVELKSKNIILAGDFNVNILNSSNNRTKSLIESMSSNNFYPLITNPTRISIGENSNYRATLIDHIWSNINVTYSSAIIEINISDHFPNFILFDYGKQLNTIHSISFRDFSLSNKNKFKEEINSVAWDNILIISDIKAIGGVRSHFHKLGLFDRANFLL